MAESQWEIVGFTVVAAGPATVAIFPFGVSLAWLLARRSWPGKLPLLVRGTRIALEAVSPRLEQVATTLGASPLRVFMTITLPLAIRGIIAGGVLTFARALGEFGATILVAGNIPGRTTTLSTSIYGDIQLGHDGDAFRLLAVSVVLAFCAVWVSEWLFKRSLPTA